jgi:DNA helicase-2/ATP-dependent DNA helicase PcrA
MPIFTKNQLAGVNHRGGHSRFPAAPGSGKTTTIVGHLLSIMDDGTLTSPDLAIVLMFGKDAKIDFEKKLAKAAPDGIGPLPQIKTFHSLALHLCKILMSRGLLPWAELEVSEGKLRFAATNAMKRHVSVKEWKEFTSGDNKIIDVFISFVDLVKANLLPAKEIFELCDFDAKLKFFINAYDTFEATRKDAKKRYFTDLITDLVVYLKANPNIAKKLSNQRSHIIVDEAQDMNLIQYEFVKILAGDRASLMLVGDIDQSIYGWRGSDPKIMLDIFLEDFKDVATYPLPDTFRFGTRLSLMANSLIQNNSQRLDTLCRSHECAINGDTKIHVHSVSDEGKLAIKAIEDALKQNVPYSEMIVLCRLYSASTNIELACLNAGHPIYVDGGKGAMSTKEATAIMSLLRISTNKMSEIPNAQRATLFEELLRFPHIGLPASELESVAKRLGSLNEGFGAALAEMQLPNVTSWQQKKARERGWLLSKIEKKGSTQAASVMISNYVKETDLYKSLAKLATTNQDASESVDRSSTIVAYVTSRKSTSADMLEHLLELKRPLGDSANGIRVTSIYKAKGLERRLVLIPGVSDGKFPNKAKGDHIIQSDPEEERRLFYVGITRAIDNVHLFCPKDVDLENYLKTGKKPLRIDNESKDSCSRFVYEMNWFSLQDYKQGIKVKGDASVLKMVKRYEKLVSAA